MKRTKSPQKGQQKRNKPRSDFVVLSNDPSLTAWGIVVLDAEGNVLEADCIKTDSKAKKLRIRKGDDLVRRIKEINDRLKGVYKAYHIKYLISELPHGSQNSNAAIMIGVVTAIVQCSSDFLNIPIEWYSEADAKKAVLGKTGGSKDDVMRAIDKLYTVPWKGFKYKDEAIADAMAIYHAAIQSSPTLKLFANVKNK